MMFKIKLKLKNISWVPGLEGVLKEGDIVTHKSSDKETYQVSMIGFGEIKLLWNSNQGGVISYNSSTYYISTFVDLFKQEIFKK